MIPVIPNDEIIGSLNFLLLLFSFLRIFRFLDFAHRENK